MGVWWNFEGRENKSKTVDVGDKSRPLDDGEEGSELQENQSPSRVGFSPSRYRSRPVCDCGKAVAESQRY